MVAVALKIYHQCKETIILSSYFIILDLLQGMNDSLNTTGFTQSVREGMKEHLSSGERQQEDPENIGSEVISSYASFPSRKGSFKLKKMSLLSDIKILTKKSSLLKNSHSSEDLIYAVNTNRIRSSNRCRQTFYNDLFIESVETEGKKENWKKILKKRKAKATLPKIPNKFQLKYSYSKRVGTTADTMKQFYRVRISLRDMDKDYIMSTINQVNKDIPCLQTSSNIVAQTIEVNTTNSISKLRTENICENIKNLSSDDPLDRKEIEYVETIPGTSMRNRAIKTNLNSIMLNQIDKESQLSHEAVNLASFLLWEEETLADLEILDWNEISSHKEEERLWENFI